LKHCGTYCLKDLVFDRQVTVKWCKLSNDKIMGVL